MLDHGDGLTTTSASTSLSYQRWDPALGTLTGAQWILSSWLVGAAIGHVSSTSTDPNALAQGEVDLRRTTAAYADLLAGESFDEAAASKVSSERVRSAERLQTAVQTALGKIHALLTAEQRKRLTYLLRTGALRL